MTNKTRVYGVVAIVITMILAVRLTPPPMPDPLVQSLELCGDTPSPYRYSRGGSVEIGGQPYAIAVKSVDDCRAKVLEHFGKDAKNS